MSTDLTPSPRKRIMVAIPAYNCARQIGRVIAQFDNMIANDFTELVIIDNRSRDATLDEAISGARENLHLPITVMRNVDNYGLGGTHKVAFSRCIDKDYDGVVILHGDDQGCIADFADLQDTIVRTGAGGILGARFHPNSDVTGYSHFRIIGNRVFNALHTVCLGSKTYDMGSGLNYFSRGLISRGLHRKMPDDLTFNNCFLLAMHAAQEKIVFKPIRWREVDQVSNARLFRQSSRILNFLMLYVFARHKFLTRDFRAVLRDGYPSEEIFSNAGYRKAAS